VAWTPFIAGQLIGLGIGILLALLVVKRPKW